MKKIFVSRLIPDQGLKILQDKGYKVTVSKKNRVLSKEELVRQLKKGYDALLCLLTDKIDEEIMDAGLPRLKIIANYAVGFDNLDVGAGKKRGLIMTNTPGPEITESVAEHTFALMIALAKRIAESDKFTRKGKYKGWEPLLLLGTDLHDKTLGIVGLGRIGFAVAQRAVKGFKMKILYHDVKRNEDFEKEFSGQYASLDELLKQSDFVSLHVPLLPSTRHLISDAQLATMKPSAFLINTARGPIVDEKALLKALTEKRIAGAGLDVYECEPSLDCDLSDQLELRKLDNVVLTPHTASASLETRQAMSRIAALNIIETLEGRVPPNVVN